MPSSTLQPKPLVLPGTPLEKVLELYERGLYSDSLQAGQELGDLRQWPGAEGRIMAGRLANNLGAPRLGRILHHLAYRAWPEHPYCMYYGALARWARVGGLHAWREFGQVSLPPTAEPRVQADWLAAKALMLATLRDFSRADELIQRALRLDPHSPWLLVQHCEILDRQDAHEAALESASEALRMQAWFRPAVQSMGHKLVQMRRDEEALQLLSAAAAQLQSGDVWCQLGMLQEELGDYEAAWQSLNRAEELWPLAAADSQHRKWLYSHRSDIAYYRGDFQQAIELAKQVERPFYEQMAQRLERAIAEPQPQLAPRVQLPVPFIRQHHETCAPATLTALARFWNHEVEHEEIVERICYEGTQSGDERRWAEENGFVAREFKVTAAAAEALIRAGLPFTLNTVEPGSAHLQAVVGVDLYRGTLILQDPSERHVGEVASEKFLDHYASSGPRGMVMLPRAEASRLEAIELPEAELYDLHYAVDRAVAEHQRSAAETALEHMRCIAAEHRLTLQSELVLARYDSNTPAQLQVTEKLIAQFPNDANLILIRLYCLSELGSRSARLRILRNACADKKSHPIFWSRLASELLDDARDHAEARRQLLKALRYHQSDGRSLALLGNLLWDQRQREAALELYRLAASVGEKDEGFARSYFQAARFLHHTSTAVEWLEDRWQRFGPRSSLPGRTLAWAHEQLDQMPRAFEVLATTLRQHPDDGDMQCHAALTFARFNRAEEAAECLAAAEGKCGASTLLRSSAAVARYQGQLARARELFLQHFEREPLDASALEAIVSLDMDLEGMAVAETRLRAAVAAFPHAYSLRVQLLQWLRANRLDEAAMEVEAFLEDYPQDAWGYREAAIIAALRHDRLTARHKMLHAIELDPTSDTAYLLLGRIAAEEGDLAGARQYFRAALERNCDNDAAIAALLDTCDRPSERIEQLDFVLGQLKTQTTFGDGVLAYQAAGANNMPPAQLLAGIEEAVANRPDLWQCWTALVAQHMAMNERSKAVAAAKEAADRFPLIPRMWVDLALVHRALGEYAEELSALERAQAINPTWTDVARALSEAYIRDKRYAEAESLLRGALAADPRSAGSQAALAECLHAAGKQQEALQPLSRACVLAPAYDWGWQTLCEWSGELDAGETAQAAARELIEQRPHDVHGPLRLAQCLREIDQIPRGLAALEDALRLDPRNVDAHVLKAFYLGRLHRWDDALEACHPPVYGAHIPVMLRMRRAHILHRKGLLETAIEQMQLALQDDPDRYQAWSQLADWADEAGKLDVYREAAENLLRIDPHQAVPHGYLADALLRDQSESEVESRAAAKEHLWQAIQLSPDYSYAALRLIDLCLEDDHPQEAMRALETTGPHLTDGYFPSCRIRIAAATQAKIGDDQFEAVDQLLQWCQAGDCQDRPLALAVDALQEPIAGAAAKLLTERIATQVDSADLGSALGRLLARTHRDAQIIKLLQDLPDGAAWHSCICFVLSSMQTFNRKLPLLTKLKSKFSRRLRRNTASWAQVGATLLNFGQAADVAAWTKDWRKRAELTPLQFITIIAANYETFRLREARAAISQALTDHAPSQTDGLDLVYVWAGLDASHQGMADVALAAAQQINPHSLGGWYGLGYRMLVSTVEAQAQIAAKPSTAEAKELLSYFAPQRFPIEAEFKTDRLSRWLLLKIQARLAADLKQLLPSLRYQAAAWYLRHW